MIQILHRWAIFNPICDGSAFSPQWWWWWWPRWRCALAKSITPSCGVRLLVVRPFRLAFMGFRICSASCPAEPSACWRLMQTYMRAAGDCTASAQQSKKLLGRRCRPLRRGAQPCSSMPKASISQHVLDLKDC
jgi:hypothetical protein